MFPTCEAVTIDEGRLSHTESNKEAFHENHYCNSGFDSVGDGSSC